MENDNEKIIKLLEEIRNNQKDNLERALLVQKKSQKKIFWMLLGMFLIVFIIFKFLTP